MTNVSKEYAKEVGITQAFIIEGVDWTLGCIGCVNGRVQPQELIGQGRIELVSEIYDYAVIVTDIYQTLPEREGPGIFDYQFSSDIVGAFIARFIRRYCELPDKNRFHEWCYRKMRHWVEKE